MTSQFHSLDWAVLGVYLTALLGMGWLFRGHSASTTKDYFLGGGTMSFWVVAVSVLATTQSAATFLGGPDQGYRGDYSYLATNVGTMLAAVIAAYVFVPRFYAMKATTVYELLERRYDRTAMRAAGLMYMVGRIFAGGSRLYMAAIAVSMILYANIEAENIIISAFLLTALGFVVTFAGGIRSVLWSDVIQFLIYASSAVAVLVVLWTTIPASSDAVWQALENAPGGQNKLTLFKFNLDFTDPFSMLSIVTGMTLLSLANFSMDQDTSQRMLTCKTSREGGLSLILSVVMAIPLIWVFISIGQLLHIFYDRPDLMGQGAAGLTQSDFDGEKITVFMSYILNEMPAGLKGLVASGVIAAAISTINSGLNSMSSVIVQDFYRPWREARAVKEERHYVMAGRASMALVGLVLFSMAVLCFYWQRYTDMPLLNFALSVMTFAYSGLLGVYFSAVLTKRGSPNSVLGALAVGFLTVLVMQPYIVDTIGLPAGLKSLAFSWQLCISTGIAFLVCQLGRPKVS